MKLLQMQLGRFRIALHCVWRPDSPTDRTDRAHAERKWRPCHDGSYKRISLLSLRRVSEEVCTLKILNRAYNCNYDTMKSTIPTTSSIPPDTPCRVILVCPDVDKVVARSKGGLCLDTGMIFHPLARKWSQDLWQ